jgi:hypothetical protein
MNASPTCGIEECFVLITLRSDVSRSFDLVAVADFNLLRNSQ